jgi:hypothetical protein
VRQHDVACGCETGPAGERAPTNGGDDRDGKLPYGGKDAAERACIVELCLTIRAKERLERIQIGARAEVLTLGVDEDDACRWLGGERLEGLSELVSHLSIKGVPLLGSGQGNAAHAF